MQSSPWKTILEVARWAPSPHNIQPWLITVHSDEHATLSYDPKRLIPDTDVVGAFTTVGFGIFIEYLAIAASHSGLTLHWETLRNGIDKSVDKAEPFFKLTLQPGGKPDIFHTDLMLKRKTSRLPYKSEKVIPPNFLKELEKVAKDFDYTFHWSQDPAMVTWLLRLNRDTLFYDMDDDVARTEVSHWIRYSEREAQATGDGLAARCMRMPGWLMRAFFKQHSLMHAPGIEQMVRWYYLRSLRGTSTIAWITGSFASQENWIQAGRMLARVWLAMTRESIYLHPFGSIITNPVAHARLSEKISYEEGANPLWLVVRMGYSNTPPTSKRLTVDQILS
jgi:hypothetical protein